MKLNHDILTQVVQMLLEILEEGSISEDEYISALVSCNASCTTLRTPAQKLLLGEILFRFTPKDCAKQYKFKHLLESYPHIKSVTKYLHFDLVGLLDDPNSNVPADILGMLGTFTSIRGLCIRCGRIPEGPKRYIPWDIIQIDLRDTLTQLITYPSVLALGISGILGFPLSLISPPVLSKLEHLCLVRLKGLERWEGLDIVESLGDGNLREFHLQECDNDEIILDPLMANPNLLSNIRILALDTPKNPTAFLRLTDRHIVDFTCRRTTGPHLDLQPFSYLEYLSIGLDERATICLPWLHASLATVQQVNRLKTIQIDLHYDDQFEVGCSQVSQAWLKVDTSLTAPHLRCLVVITMKGSGGGWDFEPGEQFLDTCIPKLASSPRFLLGLEGVKVDLSARVRKHRDGRGD